MKPARDVSRLCMAGALYHDSTGGAFLAAAALALGILATICPFLFAFSANFLVFAIPLALIALLLGIFARRGALRRSEPTGMATFAVVMGVVPLVLSTTILVFYARLVSRDRPFVPTTPAQGEKLEGDHQRNAKQFDQLFDKSLKKDKP
jgi:hypothetical protein